MTIDMTIEEIQKSEEFQVFDRKSARIDAKALAITIIAFANADGERLPWAWRMTVL